MIKFSLYTDQFCHNSKNQWHLTISKVIAKKKQCNHRPIANDFAYHTGQMSDIFTISCSQWLKVSCLNSYIQCKQNGFNNSQKGKNNHYPITSWQQTTTFFLFVCKTFW